MTSRRKLVPDPWRPVTVVVWLLGGVVLAILAWHLHRAGGGGRLDTRLDPRVAARLAVHHRLLDRLTVFGSPLAVVAGSIALAAACAAGRWWRGAVFALAAAPLAGFTTEKVLKPFVAAHVVPAYRFAFPSGHTTGAFALALVMTVLLLPDEGARATPVIARLAVGAAAFVVAVGTAVSVVALGWHHVSDAMGGAGAAVAVVLVVAALVETGATLARRVRFGRPLLTRR